MTAAAQPTFDEVLTAVVTDWRPSRVESREYVICSVRGIPPEAVR